ncbi:MAG: hypothetical protein HQ527_09455 [Cyanobacteria bacterium]|nr:hypothetical protein [Cyanobacteria bacterium bin.51]
MSSSWFDQLEAQLDRQLEAFLGSHPEQQVLLELEERQERQRRLNRQRLQIQGQAERARQSLLDLAAEITQWQQRVERARKAGAEALADQADAHVRQLMGQGRDRWQVLNDLGLTFRQVEEQLAELEASGGPATPSGGRPKASGDRSEPPDLEQAWASFEKEQALEDLRRQRRSPGA